MLFQYSRELLQSIRPQSMETTKARPAYRLTTRLASSGPRRTRFPGPTDLRETESIYGRHSKPGGGCTDREPHLLTLISLSCGRHRNSEYLSSAEDTTFTVVLAFP
jgi:hypothetical protein